MSVAIAACLPVITLAVVWAAFRIEAAVVALRRISHELARPPTARSAWPGDSPPPS